MSWFLPMKTREQFRKGYVTAKVKFPLRKKPITSDALEMLVLGRNDFEVTFPTYPGQLGFDAELAEVLRVRDDVMMDVWPGWFLENHGISPLIASPLREQPANLDEDNPKAAADIVHMDDPMDLGQLLRRWLVQNGAKHKSVDGSGNGIFLELIPGLNRKLAIAIDEALFEAAQVKQFFGRPRPEEVICYNCTSYPEGCPKHPSYVAGHGAAAGATLAVLLEEFPELPPELMDPLIRACLQWAMFRTFAGVHYANDNIMGVALGYAKVSGLKNVTQALQELGLAV